MKEETEEGVAILIIGGTAVLVALVLGIFNEAFREWFAYFLYKIPVLF